MNNPRYTARCVITREISDGSFPASEPEIKTILKSVCGFRDKNITDIDGGLIADYKISLPRYNVVVKPGDLIEVKDERQTISGKVRRDRVGNYGANIWFDEVK